MGAAVGSFPLESFIHVGGDGPRLREISLQVAGEVDRLARESFGIEVVDLEINGFNFPPQNRASVIKRMRAERARIATRYRSEGEEEALKIEAQAQAESATVLAEARSQAESIRGRGEAEALRVFAEAYRRDPDLYRFLRRLETYETILDEDTTLFLESESELLKELDGP
jgi:membrane protease subunit HflC